MTGRLQLLSPKQGAGGGSGEGSFSSRSAVRHTAAHAMIGPSLPYAAPSDAGAVRHDMFLDAHTIRHTRLLFFCEAAGKPSQHRAAARECRAIILCECVKHGITRSTSHPRPHSATSKAASLDGEPTETYKGFPDTAGRIANCS
jgi:hypothetical protein